jgi:hypothetical protein
MVAEASLIFALRASLVASIALSLVLIVRHDSPIKADPWFLPILGAMLWSSLILQPAGGGTAAAATASRRRLR